MVYEQGPCYGVCPVYKLDITEGGLLRYIGIKFVSVTDTVFENLTGEQLAELTNAFHECGFFSLDDEYLNYSVTDMPEYYTSVKIGGKIKSVRHYFGDYSAPEKLKNLYLNINEILNTKRWTGR